jgi:diguanylate cyclase (GGDEF)-like protein
METIRLKYRVLGPFLLASLFLFTFSLFGIHDDEEEHINMDVEKGIAGFRESYQALLQANAEKLSVALQFIIRNKNIAEALRKRDRQGLIETTGSVFERLRMDNGITHLYFHDAQRVNILRAHQPERFGDTIDRFSAKRAEKSGQLAWGAELGPLGTFTLRAVIPWWENGELIGYVELGEEIEEGTHALAARLGVELVVLVSKQYLNRDDWEVGMQMLNRDIEWDLLPDFVVIFSTFSVIPEQMLTGMLSEHLKTPALVMEGTFQGRNYPHALIPLRDAGNRQVGNILVLRDMTARIDSTFNTILRISAIACVIGLALFGFFYVILERTERQLEHRRIRAEEEAQARLGAQDEHVRELEHLALYDSLTDLPNRQFLDNRLNQMISTSEANNQSFMLMLLNLDRMREINNTLGHEMGDRLLKKVAGRLKISMEEADTLACFGGNGFALLFPGLPGEQGEPPIEELRALFSVPFKINGMEISVTVTTGVVRYPEHGDDASSLIRRADVALRQAKGLKKDCEIYDGSRDPYSMRRLTLASDLRKAIDGNELTLHYQPQVNTAGHHLDGVEALARWQHPEHGAVSPTEFIPLAEGTSLIGPLTFWVLDEALGQCATWVHEGLDITISVNVSAQTLIDSSFPDKVAALLLQKQLAPERLMLEVTESVFMMEPVHSLATLTKLKSIGIKLSIDDFGTGYSSLAYIKRLPVHELKIDQSFILDMLENENDATIVSSTVNLAHGLGLKVVAEGVESKEVWQELEALGCDTIQGYYAAKPMPPEKLVGWLNSSPLVTAKKI